MRDSVIASISKLTFKSVTSMLKSSRFLVSEDTFSSVKWGHLAHLDPDSANTISPTNPVGSSNTL